MSLWGGLQSHGRDWPAGGSRLQYHTTKSDLRPASASGQMRPLLLLALLMVLHTLAFVDRQIVALVVGPIKATLHLSDTRMSLLLGPAFGLFFALLGLPMGLLADRWNRLRLISACSALWSLMTAGCGLAGNFLMLLICRMGVGVGEAGLAPAAYSLLADIFPAKHLARAIAIFASGAIIGGGLAFLIGGYAIEMAESVGPVAVAGVGLLQPWQWVFVSLGIFGLIPALAIKMFAEPQRTSLGEKHSVALTGFLRTNFRAVATHMLGFSMLSLFGYGASAWLPTMLMRVHGFTLSEVGVIMGLGFMVMGVAGTFAMATLNDWLLRRGRWSSAFIVAMLNGVLFLGFAVLATSLDSRVAVIVAVLGFTLFGGTWTAVASASLQTIAPPELRGRVSAIYLLCQNVVGVGTGPLLVGLATDYVFADDMAVGRSIALVGFGAIAVAIAIFSIGFRHFGDAVRMRIEV